MGNVASMPARRRRRRANKGGGRPTFSTFLFKIFSFFRSPHNINRA
jgi:hypothetical protein